jgi:excisionase family DNA binding protein
MNNGGRKILARSIAQFCADTAVGRSLVYKAIRERDLRSIKVGRRRLILDEDGKDWLKSLRLGPDDPS